jgi:hypothetical protein
VPASVSEKLRLCYKFAWVLGASLGPDLTPMMPCHALQPLLQQRSVYPLVLSIETIYPASHHRPVISRVSKSGGTKTYVKPQSSGR